MARPTRYTQQIFGSSAGSNQMSEYGSLSASPPGNLYSGSTITPAIVQTLTNYLQGWYAAVSGAYSPPIQDMNSICYLFAYQLTYLMQLGVPEWDSGTTYYVGSLVQDGTGITYVSLTNTNLNNAVTNPTYWGQPIQNGILTPNSMNNSTVVASGNTLSYPNLTIPSGKTMTINSGGYLQGKNKIIVNGTLINNGTVII